MKNKQQGAALVIVLALLAGSLMIGISGMNSALIDERLAGNYRAATEAQMAAEKQASILLVNQSPSVSSGVCDEVAANPKDERWKGDWQDGFNADRTKAEYLSCDYGGSLVFLVKGKAGTARHFLIAGSVGQGGDYIENILEEVLEDDRGLEREDIDKLKSISLLVGGSLVRNGRSDVEGPDPVDNAMQHNVPDNTPLIQYARDNKDENFVVQSCDENFVKGDAKIVYCDGDFVGELSSVFSDLTIVAEGNIGNPVEGERIEVKEDVNVFLASGDAINLTGFGNKKITGGVWANGSVSVSGRSNFCGFTAIRGSANYNGRTLFDVESDGCSLDGSGSSGTGNGGVTIWEPLS